jgi:hypothetical protein
MLSGDETNTYSQYLKQLGYDPKDVDLWDPEAAAVATTALLLSRKGDVEGVDKWYLRAQQHKQPAFTKEKLEYIKRGESDYANNVIKNANRLFSPKTGQGISETQTWLSEKQKILNENKKRLEDAKKLVTAKQVVQNVDKNLIQDLKENYNPNYFPIVEPLPSETTTNKRVINIIKKKQGGWLDQYAPGGENPPSTLDIIKRRKQQEAIANEAARRKGMVALPDITRVNVPDEKVIETKAKPKATVKGTNIPIKQQAQLKPSYKTEQQRIEDEARGNYIENPTFGDYLGQAGYMPLLAMSDPFSMGDKLKQLRQSQSDPRLSAAQKFSQGMDIANEAIPGALLNVATEGIGEGLLPGVIRKFTGAPNMAKNLFKELPLSSEAQRLDDLMYAKKWGKQYGYKLPDNLERISQSKSLTDKTIRGLVNRHNTFVRGVSTNWDVIAAEHPEVLESLTQAGIDWKNNPKAAAEYMATHIPGDTGYGRHGLKPGENALYLSNSMPTAEGYTYGQGYKVKVKRPTDFSEGNRKQWIKQNEFDVTKDFEGSPFGEGMVKNDYIKRIPTSIRDLIMAQGDFNKMNKLQQLVQDAENKALDEYYDFSRKYKNKREQLRINTDPEYRKNTVLWPDEEAKLKNSANLWDKTKLKYYDTMLKLGELRMDVKPFMTFFKHTLGDANNFRIML